MLYPYQSPSYALFKAYIHRVLARFAPDSYKLFVATDETEFIEWATATFPGKVLSYEDSPRLSARDPLATKGGTHKSRCFSNFQKGESAVLDCLLLAACSYLIKNRSSFSDISLAFNPKLPWTMIVGPDDPVYSTDPDV